MREHERWNSLREIEESARKDALAIADAPLELGHSVAWSEVRFGRTDDLSLVHRVGVAVYEEERALCGERIPPAIRRVALSPKLIQTLGRCRHCDAEFAKLPNTGVAA